MDEPMIENIPLFSGLGDDQRALFASRMVLETRRAKELIYAQGKPAIAMYLIKSGWVRLVTEHLAVLATLGQGSLLADADVLLGRDYTTSAEAVRDVELWVLGAADLVAIVAEQPEIGLQLSAILGTTVAPLKQYLVDHRLRLLQGLNELSDPILMAVAGRLCIRTISAGETLFAAGQAPTSIFIVEEGRVSMTGAGVPAIEQGPGALVGDPNLLLGRAHGVTARALAPSGLWELSAADLDRLCGVYPDLRAAMGRALRSILNSADQARAVGLLRNTPMFQSLPAAALSDLAAQLVSQAVPTGTRIFEADAQADAMYVVESGTVDVLDVGNQPLVRVGPGGYFGEMGLVGGMLRGVVAQARGNTTLWVLSREDVEKVAARQPSLRAALDEQLFARKTEVEDQFVEKHLRRLGLLSGLTQEQMRDVAEHLRPERFSTGQAVYRRGMPSTALYLIESGEVSLEVREAGSDIQVLGSLGPGECFGETALLGGEPHTTDVIAASDLTAWALTRADFEELVLRYPSLALNLSRELSQRLRQSTERAVIHAHAAPVAAAGVAVTAATQTVPAPRPAGVAVAGAMAGLSHTVNRATNWFGSRSTSAKIRLVAVVLLLIWLLGVAAPAIIISLLSGNSTSRVSTPANVGRAASSSSVALAAALPAQLQPTSTPWPTETPIPTPTFTPTATPTNTPMPTETPLPTATPLPTETPIPPPPEPVAVEAAPAPVAVAAAEPPKPSVQFQLIEARRMTPCENKGNHHIFIKVVDMSGNPVDGVALVQVPAGQMGNVLDKMVSGFKGPGKAEFVMWKMAEYDVYVSTDGISPASSDIAQKLNSNFVDEATCSDGEGGNTLFHNSFAVTFQKTS